MTDMMARADKATSAAINQIAVRPRSRTWLWVLAGQLGFGVALILVWWAVVTQGLLKPLVARTPAEVWTALTDLVISGALWPHLWSTLSAMIIAFVLAAFVGILIGVGLGLVPRFERLIDPYISVFNAMPRIAFAPVFILYFGISQEAKIAMAFTFVVFLMIINARAGIRSADRDVLTLAKSMDISKGQLFWKVLLPSAIPSIFAAVRLGTIFALLGVVTSEMIAARTGLGLLVAEYAGSFDLSGLYAVVVVLAILAAIINTAMAWLERKFLRWQNV